MFVIAILTTTCQPAQTRGKVFFYLQQLLVAMARVSLYQRSSLFFIPLIATFGRSSLLFKVNNDRIAMLRYFSNGRITRYASNRPGNSCQCCRSMSQTSRDVAVTQLSRGLVDQRVEILRQHHCHRSLALEILQ